MIPAWDIFANWPHDWHVNRPIAIKRIGNFYNPFDVTRNLNCEKNKRILFCSYNLLVTWSAVQATQNNDNTSNILYKECQAL